MRASLRTLFSLLTVTGALALSLGCGRGPATTEKPGTGAPAVAGTDAPPKLDLGQVPANVRTPAFEYAGLSNLRPQTYRVVTMVGEEPSEGIVTNELVKIEGGNAVFRQRREGGMEFLGTDEILAKPEGIYLVTNTQLPSTGPALMTPAKMEVGTVWDTALTLADNPRQITEMKIRSKVDRAEKITTPAGEFDTILVVSTTTIKVDGQTLTSSAKAWYAKGVGVVRLLSESKDQTGRDVRSSIELVKTD